MSKTFAIANLKAFSHTWPMKKISQENNTQENIAFIILLAIAASSRLVVHNWNFTAIMAASYVFALFFRNSKTKAVLLPILAMLISDFFIGLNSSNFFHSTMTFVYAGMGLALVPFFMSRKYLDNHLVKVMSVLTGSLLFFLVSNFGVWIMDAMYPMTAQGLAQCYTLAVPFFKNQLAADVLLTPALYVIFKRLLALNFFQIVIGERH